VRVSLSGVKKKYFIETNTFKNKIQYTVYSILYCIAKNGRLVYLACPIQVDFERQGHAVKVAY
jgi:hypothetical protein